MEKHQESSKRKKQNKGPIMQRNDVKMYFLPVCMAFSSLVSVFYAAQPPLLNV